MAQSRQNKRPATAARKAAVQKHSAETLAARQLAAAEGRPYESMGTAAQVTRRQVRQAEVDAARALWADIAQREESQKAAK